MDPNVPMKNRIFRDADIPPRDMRPKWCNYTFLSDFKEVTNAPAPLACVTCQHTYGRATQRATAAAAPVSTVCRTCPSNF